MAPSHRQFAADWNFDPSSIPRPKRRLLGVEMEPWLSRDREGVVLCRFDRGLILTPPCHYVIARRLLLIPAPCPSHWVALRSQHTHNSCFLHARSAFVPHRRIG